MSFPIASRPPLLDRRRFLFALAATTLACRTARTDRPANTPDAAPDRQPPIPRSARFADVIVTGGTILTHDLDRPRATALAIADGRIIALDDAAMDPELRGAATQIVDLEGGLATPGLVDAHAHLVGLGQNLEDVDLRGAASIDDVVARLKASAPESGWITGRGWDQNLWPGKAMPTHQALTQAFPDRPVWLQRVDGHAGWGNLALLKAANIDRGTSSPAGGEILRDAKGHATGVLVDAAMGLVPVPEPDAATLQRYIVQGGRHAVARGLTGVHEMGIGPAEDAAYRALAGQPLETGLPLRIHAYASEGWFRRDLLERAPDPIWDEARYVLAGVKVYADGALGSRGAAMLEPYADRPDHRGLMQHDPKDLLDLVMLAVRGGWQVATHAIGDAANRAVLDAYAEALPEARQDDPRLRIEHCQILHPEDIARFAQLGVIASMQPTHATSDMAWVPDRIGPQRVAGAYAWQSLLDAGAHVCFGSDFPVELADVTHGLHAAITRQDAKGQPPGGWLPDERVSLAQALIAFSTEAAYAAHRDRHLGKLLPGYRGDVTCFSKNLLELEATEVRDAQVLATLVEGRVVHRD